MRDLLSDCGVSVCTPVMCLIVALTLLIFDGLLVVADKMCLRIQSDVRAMGVLMIAEKIATNKIILMLPLGCKNEHSLPSQLHLLSPVANDDLGSSHVALVYNVSQEPSSGLVSVYVTDWINNIMMMFVASETTRSTLGKASE